jgi:hypothetical protein
MTAHQIRSTWRAVLDLIHGVDAGALIAHGREVPPDHPARRRRLDHEEVERRLAELYPRDAHPPAVSSGSAARSTGVIAEEGVSGARSAPQQPGERRTSYSVPVA